MRLSWILLLVALAGCGRERKAEAPRKTAPAAPVRITHFYASPPVLERGQRATVCYGVENARQVRLDPPVEALRPLYHRCFEVAPQRDTTYTLEAVGADGTTARASFEIRVAAGSAPAREVAPVASSLIAEFVATPAEVSPGERATVCYQVAEGVAIRLEPDVARPAGPRACFSIAPRQTTAFTLIATEPDGRVERRSVVVRVR
ncbi:MAG: hypothetical protein RMI94_00370 [Bryobacterales bacterium]|nr:hypothetical protein [Bryobacteraceae bacterium]MDW8128974.1 hypothetical protein [Bryobacterales bacterium]